MTLEPAGRPWWRWPVYIFATASTLMASLLLMGLGAPLGWGGRSTGEILAVATLIVVLPSALTILAAIKAIIAAQSSSLPITIGWLTLALTAIPLTLWGYDNAGRPF